MVSRDQLQQWSGGAIEALTLGLVCLSPWALGAVEPIFEAGLYTGIAFLLVLWGLQALAAGRVSWKKCPVALCLVALILLALFQMQPLPRTWLVRLSPNTARLLAALLPAEPEVLPPAEVHAQPPLAAGSSLSLYPGATRQELVRLAAVLLLFLLVRNASASAASLRRLSIALVLNGSLLALVGILQYASSPRDTIYWSIHKPSEVFGPFASRNHFPFYVNACVGAAVGLLFSLNATPAGGRTGRQRRRYEAGRANPLAGLLGHPAWPWLVCALGLMISSVALSLSRGGFLSLLSGAVLVLLVCPVRSLRRTGLATVLGAVAVAVVLVAWFGFGRVEGRLATIWKGQALKETRIPLWADCWQFVPEFPWLGTGYGSFTFVEPMHRTRIAADPVYEHAHNEYLEALIEGGAVRLLISLAAITLVFWFGCRAARRYADRPAGGLALGALFGFTALVVHSTADYGLHLPAITVLATVLIAQLVAVGRDPPDRGKGQKETVARSVLLPFAFFLFTCVAGWGLFREGQRLERAESFRSAAAILNGKGGPAVQLRQVALLEAAAALAPESVQVQTELGQLHLARYERRISLLRSHQHAVQAAQIVMSAAPAMPKPPMPLAGPFAVALSRNTAGAGDREAARQDLVPALRAYLQARDACPLVAQSHLCLAANRPTLVRADPRQAYLDRAKKLFPVNPEIWFLAGSQELLDEQPAIAARSWHRCLELTDLYLPRILSLGRTALAPEELRDLVLPERPELLVAAAEHLYPNGEAGQRQPFLEKALALLQDGGGPHGAQQLQLRARVERALDRPSEAVVSYRKALAKDPQQVSWRFELATLLHGMGRSADARQELTKVLRQQPGCGEARELLDTINRELRKGK
jgi:O-antigen ligase/tetratricopeptide (TPR) repeat protein